MIRCWLPAASRFPIIFVKSGVNRLLIAFLRSNSNDKAPEIRDPKPEASISRLVDGLQN